MKMATVGVTQLSQQLETSLISVVGNPEIPLKSASETLSSSWNGAEADGDIKKSCLDLAFRRVITKFLLKRDPESDEVELDSKMCEKLIELSINAATSGLCSPTAPITVLSDLFDLVTLDRSVELFQIVEDHLSTWKQPPFFAPVKNHLLRMCNDLLRRLSRTQNTAFCGKILLFLAKFFPFSDRSGLNIISEFNLDNTTVYNEEKQEGEEATEKSDLVIEKDEKNLNIDYALYRKFWQLQDFFRNPTQCYTRLKWKTFSTYSTDVLNIFQSFKLDAVAGKKKIVDCTGDDKHKEEQYFAKYLTNQNLLQLQLSDSNFRRYVLLQFLILFQYLQSSVKFKVESEVLSDEQEKWIQSANDKVYKLMGETPPDGDKFAKSVRHLLKREEQWNKWKNDGCPPFKKASSKDDEETNGDEDAKKSQLRRRRKRKLGDLLQEADSQKKFLMGNSNLTRLWNVCPDNMEACSAPERDFLPTMEKYFEEATEQLIPENQVDDEYKKVFDGSWGWRALRLLAKKSPHFFSYANAPIAKLEEYLKNMLKKIDNESENPKLKDEKSSSKKEDSKKAETEGEKSETKEEPKNSTISEKEMKNLAVSLGDKWTKLIPKLGFTDQDKEAFKKEGGESVEAAAEAMLKKWKETEGEEATPDEMRYQLEGLKMDAIAVKVFGEKS